MPTTTDAAAAVGKEPVYRFEPLKTRLNEAFMIAVLCGTAGGIAAFVIGLPRGLVVLGATVVVATWGARRAFRMSIEASSEYVIVRNYFREYKFGWLDVTKIGLGEIAVGAATGPAVAFFLRDGRVVRAQATPLRAEQQEPVFRALASLAPPSVEFLPTAGLGDRSG